MNAENFNSTSGRKHDETIIDDVKHNQTDKYQSTNSRIKKSYERSGSDFRFVETINSLASQFLKQDSNAFLERYITDSKRSAMVVNWIFEG